MNKYKETYQRWEKNPLKFWDVASADIEWIKPPSIVFNDKNGPYGTWFSDGVCNTCFNCLDRHIIDGRGEQPALIYDSPITGVKSSLTYLETKEEVSILAQLLLNLGVKKGDTVIIYMPMIPQTALAMLACARIGAIHSVVFGGFASQELSERINDAQPKIILSASCGIEPSRVVEYKPLLDEAIKIADHKPDASLIFQRAELKANLNGSTALDWEIEIAKVRESGKRADCVPLASSDPLYILYTSGTTGQPKGVVRDNGGHMVALKWAMKNIYKVNPGDVYWAASDFGWVVGHTNIVYGALLHGCTTIIFEGKPIGTPDAGVFWRVIEDYKVSVVFSAPTAFRAIKKEDPTALALKDHDISSLHTLFLAGERADTDTIIWLENNLNIPVIDHWWQTESGWPMAANPMGIQELPIKYGSSSVPMPGYTIQILDENGDRLPANTLGAISIKLPLPPGCLMSLWKDDQRFVSSYLDPYPGFYHTADAGYMDEDGYLFIMSRTDDIINVAGHRLSTGVMEDVLSGHQDVAECCVIGIADDLKGQIPIGVIVLNTTTNKHCSEIETECVHRIRNKIGAVASLKTIITVDRLPKTRSGKILRGTMREIIDGHDWKMPATIDDPKVISEIISVFKTRSLLG